MPPLVAMWAVGRGSRGVAAYFGLFVAAAGVTLALKASGSEQAIWGTLVAIAIRAGLFPFHAWPSLLLARAPFGAAVLALTPLPATLATLRLIVPSAPEIALSLLAVLALITAIYAAGLALVRSEARSFFAALATSQSALILVGIGSGTRPGLAGATAAWPWLALALTTTGMTIAALEARHGRLDWGRPLGLAGSAPWLAGLMIFAGLA